MTTKNTTAYKPTLDTTITTDDGFLMAFIKSAFKAYIVDSGISKSDMERFVTDYVTFDNGFVKASGPAFQMKVMAEAIETYIHDNNIQNATLEKFIFECQKAYRQIYDLPTYKYSSEHLQTIGNDYKTYLSPVSWNEDIYIEAKGSDMDDILQESANLPTTSFSVPTVNYASIEVEELSPQLALKQAVQMANEDPFEHIGDAEIQRVLESQDNITGENHYGMAPVSINPDTTPSDSNTAFIAQIFNHPKSKMIFDHVMNEALIIRDQNVSNSDFGDANPEIFIVEEDDDYNFEIARQTPRTHQISFIYDIDPTDIDSIFNAKQNEDGSYSVGFSGNLSIDKGKESTNSWRLKADNFNDLMKIKTQIDFFKIEREVKNGNLENIYETNACPNSLYKRYVSNTGNDPLDNHPDIMEKFHFPPKFASNYKPNALETLLNLAKTSEITILNDMDEALDEFSDGTGRTVEELLQDGDIHHTQTIRDKYDYYHGKLDAIKSVLTLLSTNNLDKALNAIPKLSTKTQDLLSFQKHQQGLQGETEIYSGFVKEIDNLHLTPKAQNQPTTTK